MSDIKAIVFNLILFFIIICVAILIISNDFYTKTEKELLSEYPDETYERMLIVEQYFSDPAKYEVTLSNLSDEDYILYGKLMLIQAKLKNTSAYKLNNIFKKILFILSCIAVLLVFFS